MRATTIRFLSSLAALTLSASFSTMFTATANAQETTDDSSARRDCAVMVKRGFRMRAELIGYEGWSPALKWGYLAAHVHQIRFEIPPHPINPTRIR